MELYLDNPIIRLIDRYKFIILILLSALASLSFVTYMDSQTGVKSAQKPDSTGKTSSLSEVLDGNNSIPGTVITVKVEAAGSVIKPGVYELKDGSRISDLLDAAGGLNNFADKGYVSRSISLAEPIVDGEKVYIPKIGENDVPLALTQPLPSSQKVSSSSSPSTSQKPISTTKTTSKQININSASSDDLDTLPGIGPAYSQRIISNRPYKNFDDLYSKTRISMKLLEKLKDLIRFK